MSELTIKSVRAGAVGGIVYTNNDIVVSDGRETIAIYNRNIGASSTGTTLNAATVGNYYQRGNTQGSNYTTTPAFKTYSDNAYTKSAADPYSDAKFYSGTGKMYIENFNFGLYGGNDDINGAYNRGWDIPNKGQQKIREVVNFIIAAGGGYHIPTGGERNQLVRLYCRVKGWTPQLNTASNGHLRYFDTQAHQTQFLTDMRIPLAGLKQEQTAALTGNGTYAYLWTCSYNCAQMPKAVDGSTEGDGEQAMLFAMGGTVQSSWLGLRACRVGCPIRAFKNGNIIYPA